MNVPRLLWSHLPRPTSVRITSHSVNLQPLPRAAGERLRACRPASTALGTLRCRSTLRQCGVIRPGGPRSGRARARPAAAPHPLRPAARAGRKGVFPFAAARDAQSRLSNLNLPASRQSFSASTAIHLRRRRSATWPAVSDCANSMSLPYGSDTRHGLRT